MTSAAAPTTAPMLPAAILASAFTIAIAAASIGFRGSAGTAPIWDVPWAVVTGGVGGVAFWRLGRPGGEPVVLPAATWFGVLAIGSWRADGFDAPFGRWDLLVAALSTVALVATLRPARAVLAVLVVGAAAALAVAALVPSVPTLPVFRRHDAGVAAGALLAVSLAWRRREILAAAAMSVTIALDEVLHLTILRGSAGRHDGLRPTLPLAVLVAAACLAATAASSVQRPAPSERGARAIVAAQRHPWRTCLAISAVAACVAAPWPWTWTAPLEYVHGATRVALAGAAVAFAFHAGRGSRSMHDSLAPLLTASVVAAALSASLDDGRSIESGTEAALVAVPAAWMPLLIGFLSIRRLESRRPMPAVLAGALFLGVVAWSWTSRPDETYEGASSLFLWTSVAALAFHAVATSRAPTGAIVLGAAVLGALEWVRNPEIGHEAGHWWFHGHHLEDGYLCVSMLVTVGAWVAAALLAVGARRFRGITAVPADHPIVAEFGGG